VRTDKKPPNKIDKKTPSRMHKRAIVGYSKKSALLEEAITYMNAGKYGRSSAALKELLSLDPHNTEARRLFATLHLRLGSLVTARQAFESLANEAIGRQDFWLAESLLGEYLVAGPRCVPFLELLAHVHEEKGDAMAAVAELGKAIDILIEDPDAENPKKPADLYAKVRELAPASSVACQFASLFDIQTGDLLISHNPAPASATSPEVEALQPQDSSFASAEESETSDVMPWEQLDEAPLDETAPSTSSDAVFQLLDLPTAETVLVDSALQDLKVPQPKPIGPNPEVNRLDQDILAEQPIPSSRDRHDEQNEMGPIIERPPFDEEHTHSSSEERLADIECDLPSSVVSPGLSSPMPWEQIENSTIGIEETASPTVPPTQSDEMSSLSGSESVFAPSATTQSEFVSNELSNPAPDLTEPRESTFAEEPSINPAVFPEPVPAPSAADSSSAVPFSWNAVFDGAGMFAGGTVSSSSPAALYRPDMNLQNARELESVQLESVPEPELSSPSISSTLEPPVSFSDSKPLSLAHPSIVSEVSGIEIPRIKEPDPLSCPTPVLFSKEPSQPEHSPIVSSDVRSSFQVDLPVPPPEPIEPSHISKPVSSLLLEVPSVSPFPKTSAPEPLRSVSIPESSPEPEPASTERHDRPTTLFQAADGVPLSEASGGAPSASPASMDMPTHWSTGEIEVQPHRPSEKKRNWDKEKGEAPIVSPALLPPAEESPKVAADLLRSGGWESALPETGPIVGAVIPVEEKAVLQEDTRPEWVRASESITFVNVPLASSAPWQDSTIESTPSKPEPAFSVAASAVDILFDSTGEKSQLPTQDRVASPRPRPRFAARVARVRIGISSYIGSCFSTTRSIAVLCVGLVLSCVVLVAVGVGAIGLAWMVMEAPPSSVYYNLTMSPPEAFTDSRRNGYFLLLGFDVSAEQDPLQAGYNRKAKESDLQAANACMLGDKNPTGASANVVREWFSNADPAAQFKLQSATVRLWAMQESIALKRYQQWLSMPFEDVGYGQIVSPNCAHIVLAHRLYLAEGFAQDLNLGLARLETDMGAWRTALGQSKTLMVKMLAATVIQDDIATASGLLIRQDLDGEAIGHLGKIVRPMDQVELSLRWPMQSHLTWATKSVTTSLKNDATNGRPFHIALAAAMPLPVQRRSNAYADYYAAASKAVAEERYTNLPKPSSFIRTPGISLVDYLANPIEHIIGIEPLPSWDPYVGHMVEADAQLRLASLQVWIRRGPQEGNILARLAKAGQAHYDPFTGLPMLVDQQKGVIYSVGQDGKDQGGDPLRDVVITIPRTQSVVIENSRSFSSPSSK
jgi:hypothetical protein